MRESPSRPNENPPRIDPITPMIRSVTSPEPPLHDLARKPPSRHADQQKPQHVHRVHLVETTPTGFGPVT